MNTRQLLLLTTLVLLLSQQSHGSLQCFDFFPEQTSNTNTIPASSLKGQISYLASEDTEFLYSTALSSRPRPYAQHRSISGYIWSYLNIRGDEFTSSTQVLDGDSVVISIHMSADNENTRGVVDWLLTEVNKDIDHMLNRGFYFSRGEGIPLREFLESISHSATLTRTDQFDLVLEVVFEPAVHLGQDLSGDIAYSYLQRLQLLGQEIAGQTGDQSIADALRRSSQTSILTQTADSNSPNDADAAALLQRLTEGLSGDDSE